MIDVQLIQPIRLGEGVPKNIARQGTGAKGNHIVASDHNNVKQYDSNISFGFILSYFI